MKVLKKILTTVAIIVVTANTAALANYDLNMYDENFEYSDESAAMALNTSTVFVYGVGTATISYKPVTIKTNSIVNYIAELQRANPDVSVQTVYDYVLNHVTDYIERGNTKTTEVSMYWNGSGVVLSEDGYIATNHHVVEPTEDERLEAYVNQLVTVMSENYSNIVQSIESLFGSGALSDEQKEEISELIVGEYEKYAEITSENIDIYVLYPGSDGEASVNENRMYETEIIKIGGEQGSPEDTAIIKVNANNMVTLELAESYPNTGSTILTAGYPDGGQISEQSLLTATITSGNIGATKAVDGSNYKFISTDASVSSGNSGGPSVNNRLRVVGLNTIVKSSETTLETYHYMLPAEAVNEIASDLNIGMGDVSKTFLLGIQAMQQGYGKTAVECFQAVKEARADTPYINQYISQAETLPQKDMPMIKIEYLIVGGGILAVIVIIALAVIVLSKKKRRNVYNPLISATIEDSPFIPESGDTGGVIGDEPSNSGNEGMEDWL